MRDPPSAAICVIGNEVLTGKVRFGQELLHCWYLLELACSLTRGLAIGNIDMDIATTMRAWLSMVWFILTLLCVACCW